MDDHPLNSSLPAADVVLHCGDLTHCGGTSSYKKAIKLLASIDAKLKLVIAGNHDLELDNGFWKTHLDEGDELEDHDEAMEVMRGKLARDAGVVYLEEGIRSFKLENGARLSIYTSPYTPAFNDWAFAYQHDQDRFNKPQDTLDGITSIAENPMPDFGEVDVVMTHGPPKGILDHCAQGDAGCPNLLQAITRARPLLHCFGHIHEGSGAVLVDWGSSEPCGERTSANISKAAITQDFVHGEKSLMINAAINDAVNTPSNNPWVVDLLLPRAALDETT
ncbi:MAG: hypothetical protein Q9208_008572 [Pyrenodesmia sp. 3 TL-2023]